MKADDSQSPEGQTDARRGNWGNRDKWSTQQYVFSVHCCQNAVDTSPAQGDLSSKLCPIPAFALWPISSVSLRFHTLRMSSAFPGGSVAKNSPANVGATGDSGSIPGSGRSPGGRYGNLLHYSCLENPMDRGAWWATVPGVAKTCTQLSNWAISSQHRIIETIK